MGCPSVPGEPINQYALVTYLPEELGAYLDQVRKELVPACQARSHLSILPPRALSVSCSDAENQVQRMSKSTEPFVVKVGEVQVFPMTGVIYLELAAGKEAVETLHASLNAEAFLFAEPYPFHPHVTLAQNFPLEESALRLEQARAMWSGYRGRREFLLDRVVFVQNSCTNCWRDLRTFRLEGMPRIPVPVGAESIIRTF